MCVLVINQVFVTRSLFYYHRGEGCMYITSASIDLPCKTIISIPIWLFNSVNEKCLFYMAAHSTTLSFAQLNSFHLINSLLFFYHGFTLFSLCLRPAHGSYFSVLLKLKQNVGPFPCAVQSVGEGCRLKSLPLGALTRLFSTARQGDSLHTFSFMAPSLFIITQLQFY